MNLMTATPTPFPFAKTGGGIPTDGLLGEYLFEDNVNDTSGNGRNATIPNGATYTTGKIGAKAITLSAASSQYVELPTLSAWEDLYNVDFTCAIWVKSTDTTSSRSVIGNFSSLTGAGTTPNQFWFEYLPSTSGAVNMFVRRDNGAQTLIPSPVGNIADGSWHLLLLEKTGVTFNQWIDNSLLSTGSFSIEGHTNNNRPVRIGVNFGRYMSGAFDGLRLWDRSLTADGKTALFNET
jgi:hypothetical protein